jgi:hypothetical protein
MTNNGYITAPAIPCPYKAKTTDLRANLDGTVQSRVLIHDWTGRLGLLVAIVDDLGDGGAPRFDFNPNADAADRVAAFNAWLSNAYPDVKQEVALEWLYDYLLDVEGVWPVFPNA